MLELFRSQSRSAAGAIKYVTIGTLMMIWAGLWYYYYIRPVPNPPTWQTFVCVGTIMSGFAVAVIGLMFGLIGRGAKAADTTVAAASNGTTAPVVQVLPTSVRASGQTVLPGETVLPGQTVLPVVTAVPAARPSL